MNMGVGMVIRHEWMDGRTDGRTDGWEKNVFWEGCS